MSSELTPSMHHVDNDKENLAGSNNQNPITIEPDNSLIHNEKANGEKRSNSEPSIFQKQNSPTPQDLTKLTSNFQKHTPSSHQNNQPITEKTTKVPKQPTQIINPKNTLTPEPGPYIVV